MSPSADPPNRDRLGGERRQLTMLFCDLVDSTGLSERQDPEDLRDILQACQKACIEEIVRFQGQVSHYSGDGMMAQFGYPVAIEKGPQAAVRAALSILARMRVVAQDLQQRFGEAPAIRIGIQTGLVVVGEMGTDSHLQTGTLVGEAANVAARLQSIARPNGVVVGDATAALLGDGFDLRPLGPQALRGLTREIVAFEVEGERYRADPWSAPSRKVAFVGREGELERLLAQWRAVGAQSGRAVAVIGDAGIGKSRLVQELREAIREDGVAVLTLAGSVHHGNVALHPFIERLRHEGDDAPEPSDPDVAALVRELVSPAVLHGGRPHAPVTPELRRKLHDHLVATSLGAAGRLLLVIEDAHWLDPSSLEVVDRLVAAVAQRPVLLVVTSRTPVKLGAAAAAPVELGRLDADACRRIVESVAGAQVPDHVVRSIDARCDGTPLFAEELALAFAATGAVGAGAEAAAVRYADTSVPAALHDSLLARLDRLGDAKSVAQQAAVLGRKFRRDLLATVRGGDAAALDAPLARLADAGIVVRDPSGVEGLFEFRHALLRDAAYQSMLKGQRRALHADVGRAIESTFPVLKELEPDLVAQHWALAAEPERAARYGLKAARLSAMRSSNVEAVAQASAVMEQARLMPAGSARDAIEIEACVATMGPLIATRGYGAPEVAKLTTRALELAQTMGPPTEAGLAQAFPILYCQWSHLQVTGQVRDAHALATKIKLRSDAQTAVPPKIIGRRLLGTSQLLLGDPAQARTSLEDALALYDAAEHAGLAYVYGTDFGVMSKCHLAIACWHLGDLARCQSLDREAQDDAKALEHANTQGYALTHLCLLRALERDISGMAGLATELIALSRQRELPFWGAVALGFVGWYETCAGKPADGVVKLLGGLQFMNRMNLVYWMPTYRTWLAEAQLAVGDTAAADQSLAEALRVVERGDERWFESECWRVRAKLDLARGAAVADVMRTLKQSLDAAASTGSQSFALRTAIDVCRLAARDPSHGWDEPPRELLERCLAPFRNGPLMADQRDALALLDAEPRPVASR